MSLFQKEKPLNENSPEINKFNHNLSLLIKQLKVAYPNDQDLKLYGEKFEWSKGMNAHMVCKLFMNTTRDYIHPIIWEKEKEFIEMDFQNKVSDPSYLNMIDKIIKLWVNLPEDPKLKENHIKLQDNIWSYLKLLLNYGARALNDDQLIQDIKTELKAFSKYKKQQLQEKTQN